MGYDSPHAERGVTRRVGRPFDHVYSDVLECRTRKVSRGKWDRAMRGWDGAVEAHWTHERVG